MDCNTFNNPYEMKKSMEPQAFMQNILAAREDSGDIKMAKVAGMGWPPEYFKLKKTSLKMKAASICIPKDDPEHPRGQDAHFVSTAAQTIGVADGVGGWIKVGIDSGEYAGQLMANALHAVGQEPEGEVNPKRVLESAYNSTAVEGSSTACIITLSGDRLRAANVGDSGFVVIRNGGVHYKSPTQQKTFNCPYQLGLSRDDPSVAEEMEVAVEGGDVVVAGTDGLLDNMHDREMVEIVCNRSMRDEKEMAEQACYMANAALYNSFDRFSDSPYSIAARKAGRCHRGGKTDDITVVIARIDQVL